MQPAKWKFLPVAVLGLLSALAQAAGIGMVLDAKDAKVIDAKGKDTPLDIAMSIEAGQRIALDPQGEVSFIFYPTREIHSARGPALILIEPSGPKMLQGEKPRVRQLPAEKIEGMQGYNPRIAPAALVMRSQGTPRPLEIVMPLENEVVLDDRPLLTWSGGPANAPATVILYDGERKRFESPARDSNLRVPEQFVLQRGRSYRWEVRVEGADPRGTTFTVASIAERDRLEKLRPPENAPVADWVLYAVSAEVAKCFSAARQAWQRIGLQRPDSAIAASLGSR